MGSMVGSAGSFSGRLYGIYFRLCSVIPKWVAWDLWWALQSTLSGGLYRIDVGLCWVHPRRAVQDQW